MRLNRRNVLVGLGTIVAGGGGALATGAFSTVEAKRSVTVDVDDDATALIGLQPGADAGNYVTTTDGKLEINLSEAELGAGINTDSTLTINNALTVTNNHDSEVAISFSDDSTEIDFKFNDTANPTYTLASGGSETDIDLTVVTGASNAESFNVVLTVTAQPTP